MISRRDPISYHIKPLFPYNHRNLLSDDIINHKSEVEKKEDLYANKKARQKITVGGDKRKRDNIEFSGYAIAKERYDRSREKDVYCTKKASPQRLKLIFNKLD